MSDDALAAFKVWEGEELGENRDEPPGLDGVQIPPKTLLHVAGAWAMSSARTDRAGNRHPAVYARIIAGQVGTGPHYHVLDIAIDADIAEELGKALQAAAARARDDIAATEPCGEAG